MNKESLGPGPWQDEPDAKEFQSRGYTCILMRTPIMGTWNGYVNIPKHHPWYGIGCDNIDAYVHGGLTYAKNELPDTLVRMQSQDSLPSKWLGGWWVGFDTGHAHDIPRWGGVYKPLSYVENELENLVTQAIEATSEEVPEHV
jgi:hypothetical protein